MGDYREITLYFDPAQREKVEAFLRETGALHDDEQLDNESPLRGLELNYGGWDVWENCPEDVVLLARIGQGDYGAMCAVSPKGAAGSHGLHMCADSGELLVEVDPHTAELSKLVRGALAAYVEVCAELGVDT